MGTNHPSPQRRWPVAVAVTVDPHTLRAAVAQALLRITSFKNDPDAVQRCIRGLHVHDGAVLATIDAHALFSRGAIRDATRALLQACGVPEGARLELLTTGEARAVAAEVNAALSADRSDARRLEGISHVEAVDAKTVQVVIDADAVLSDVDVRTRCAPLIAAAGGAALSVHLKRADPPPPLCSADAQRLFDAAQLMARAGSTANPHQEVVGLRVDGDALRVSVRQPAQRSDADIVAAVRSLCAELGVKPRHIVIDTATFVPPPTMKDVVATFAAAVKTAQARSTRDRCIEDAVMSVRVKGPRVEVGIRPDRTYPATTIKAWVKQQLKARGVLLPVQFKSA